MRRRRVLWRGCKSTLLFHIMIRHLFVVRCGGYRYEAFAVGDRDVLKRKLMAERVCREPESLWL